MYPLEELFRSLQQPVTIARDLSTKGFVVSVADDPRRFRVAATLDVTDFIGALQQICSDCARTRSGKEPKLGTMPMRPLWLLGVDCADMTPSTTKSLEVWSYPIGNKMVEDLIAQKVAERRARGVDAVMKPVILSIPRG